MPDVTNEDTRISVRTTRAIWLSQDVPADHSDAFMPPPGSREFSHLHQDGSIHAVVADAIEEEIIRSNWGKRHPLYASHGVKEIIVYAPRNKEELEPLKSYEYATGRTLSA